MEQAFKLNQLHDYLESLSRPICERNDECSGCPFLLAARQQLKNYTGDCSSTSRCAITFIHDKAKSATL